jgi:O-methyltransferase involved in polyketide biosynthesis
MELTAIENTAWLTVYCRYLQSKKKNGYLKDPVSEWLVENIQTPSFKNRIRKSVLTGVPARTAVIDELITKELVKARLQQASRTYIAIGSGLDARWERFRHEIGTTINDYYEVDFKSILEYKRDIISGSPYKDLYSRIIPIAANVKNGLPDELPAIASPALVVLEGIMMYLTSEEQIRLLTAIRKKAPNAVVITDVYNSYAATTANKNNKRSTGSEQVQFAIAPEDPVQLYKEHGWHIPYAASLIREIIDRNKLLLRFIPLPEKITNSYLLLKMHL